MQATVKLTENQVYKLDEFDFRMDLLFMPPTISICRKWLGVSDEDYKEPMVIVKGQRKYKVEEFTDGIEAKIWISTAMDEPFCIIKNINTLIECVDESRPHTIKLIKIATKLQDVLLNPRGWSEFKGNSSSLMSALYFIAP